MRPEIEKKTFKPIHLVYIVIIVICVGAIGYAVYMQYFKDEKIGVIFGITSEEEDEEIINLTDNFYNIFDNTVEIVKGDLSSVDKIKSNEDIIMLAYNFNEQTENYSLDVKIPYLNVNSEVAIKIDNEIKSIFKEKLQSVIASKLSNNIIYNVRYKAYLNNDVISLVILSELKEENSSQRIIVQTYNYSISQDKEVLIEDILNSKNINENEANTKIKNKIKSSQEQNIKLAELGYNVNVREVQSDVYSIKNAKTYFVGLNGYLYVIYAYGNNEFTSEMDIAIFK